MATALILDVASQLPKIDAAFVLQSVRIPLIIAFIGVFLMTLLYVAIVLMSSDQTIFNLLKLAITKRSGPPVAPFGVFECVHNMTSEQQPWFPLRARNILGVDTFVLPLPRRPIMTGDYELAREVLNDPLSVKPKVYMEFEPRRIGTIFTRNGPYWVSKHFANTGIVSHGNSKVHNSHICVSFSFKYNSYLRSTFDEKDQPQPFPIVT